MEEKTSFHSYSLTALLKLQILFKFFNNAFVSNSNLFLQFKQYSKGSVTFSSKIKRISADHPPGPVIGRRDIEVLCDWAAVYSPLLLAEL